MKGKLSAGRFGQALAAHNPTDSNLKLAQGLHPSIFNKQVPVGTDGLSCF